MVGLVVVGVVLLVGAQRLGHLNSEELGALITVTVLLALTIPIAVVLGRLDKDPGLTTLLLAAFVAKMIGAYVRYTVLYDVYEGLGDAARYYDVGLQLADQFKDGNYVFGEVSGSRFIEILSGLAYTVLPRSQLAGFVLFSWVAFLGLILFSRAIRIALPTADHRRYDLLLFFLPTLVFWPSSIGKEAWMVAVLGLASYGAARLFTHRVSGLVPLGLGLWGASVVRPHMALMILAALGPAWLVRPSGRNRLGLSPFVRAIGFAALIVVLLAVVSQAETFFGIERLDAEGAEVVATNNQTQTGQGGSKFEAVRGGLPRRHPRRRDNHPLPSVPLGSGQHPGTHHGGRGHGPVRPDAALVATTLGAAEDDDASALRPLLPRVHAGIHRGLLQLQQLRHPGPPTGPVVPVLPRPPHPAGALRRERGRHRKPCPEGASTTGHHSLCCKGCDRAR